VTQAAWQLWHAALVFGLTISQWLLWASPLQGRLKARTLGDDTLYGRPWSVYWMRLAASMTVLFAPTWAVLGYLAWRLSGPT
jgi:hypothetical protein